MTAIVVLTGHAYSGKTSIANGLARYFDFNVFKTSLLLGNAGTPRSTLITAGDARDENDGGAWLTDAIRDELANTSASRLCVDRVRKPVQLERLREAFDWRLTHVHVRCSPTSLEDRFERSSRNDDLSFQDLMASDNKNEDAFSADADLIIDTDINTQLDAIVRIAARLKLLPQPNQPCVDVLFGAQYGSEGKGQVAAYLAREYDVLVRVGGPNAGHSVKSESGKFVYHHLPSGCRDTRADVLLGAGAVIHPDQLVAEIDAIGIGEDRLSIDPDCVCISDQDIAEETAGLRNAIGSTAQGVGRATARKITERGSTGIVLAKNVPALKPYITKVLY